MQDRCQPLREILQREEEDWGEGEDELNKEHSTTNKTKTQGQ